MIASNSKYYGALIVVVAITVSPAVYLGRQQAVRAGMLEQAARRLSEVPTQFGSWLLRDEETLSESVLNLLGCSSHLCRTYVNGKTGEAVALVFLAGPAGPLAVHTPEICMTSREYETLKQSEPMDIGAAGSKHRFFHTMFRAKTLEGQKLDVYYAWSRDGVQWEAPDSPRLVLGPLPMLYKLQVACTEPAVTAAGHTAAVSFLVDLLPHLSSGDVNLNSY
jgi:uncharacterized protein DUF3485